MPQVTVLCYKVHHWYLLVQMLLNHLCVQNNLHMNTKHCTSPTHRVPQ